MSFTLKPTRMSVSDLRPTLSYRVGVPARTRSARHWIELALATDAALFDPEAKPRRGPANFATFKTRFPLVGDSAVLHIPPATLLALSGGARLYAGAALFDAETGGAALSVIRPDADSVYVAAEGFTGAGITQRFGFAGRPGLTGAALPAASVTPAWAGDLPDPHQALPAVSVPAPSSPPAPGPARPEPTTEGTSPMSSQQFLHQNTQLAQPQTAQPHPPGAFDYDDGFGTPPPPAQPPAQPMGGGMALPYGGGGGGNGPMADPLEYVLPEFDSYNPLDVLRTLRNAWSRYKNFTAGVSSTAQFPFSAIVLLQMHARSKADPTQEAQFLGTGAYIGEGLILTAAHNMAEDSAFEEAYKIDVFVGMNSKNGAGGTLDPAHALAAFSVNQSDWTINPHYTTNGDAHDIAVIRTSVAPPNGKYFKIANFSPRGDTKIAVCGYAGGSRAQKSSGFAWQKFLPTAKSDGKQHLDADRIRSTLAGGEAIAYNLHTLKGTSGSPVFIMPDGETDEDAEEQMQIIGVHRRSRNEGEPNTNFENVGVLMTPRKRDWALSGGTKAIALDYAQEQAYAEPMVEPATWVAIASLVGTATSAGIAGLKSSDGDITWNLQKMEGWLNPGEHPTPTIPDNIPPDTMGETTFIEIKSPEYKGTFQGDMYAHFHLRFRWNNAGVGGIVIDKQPYDTKDNLTGGMLVTMQITPLLQTFKSIDDPNHQVAAVEVKMQYAYQWTASNSDHVTVIYQFYGDGTWDSRVVGGQKTLSDNSLTYTPRQRT